MHLKELKTKAPAQLVEMAEELGVEGASTLRKQDLMFSILKELAEEGEEIIGSGTIEVSSRRCSVVSPALLRMSCFSSDSFRRKKASCFSFMYSPSGMATISAWSSPGPCV